MMDKHNIMDSSNYIFFSAKGCSGESITALLVSFKFNLDFFFLLLKNVLSEIKKRERATYS